MRLRKWAVFATLSVFGVSADAQTCGVLCDYDFWKSASSVEVAAEISKVDSNTPNEVALNALMAAAGLGTNANLQAFLDGRVDVEARDELGATALMWAAWLGTTESLTLLLEAGADVNTRNNNGSTALMYATGPAAAERLAMLLDAGSNVNAQNKLGTTALMLAAEGDAAASVKVLLDARAVVNLRDRQGWTALMHAARWGNVDSVSLLLSAGADISVIDNRGNTAWDLAQLNNKLKGTDVYLMLHGAPTSAPVPMTRPARAAAASTETPTPQPDTTMLNDALAAALGVPDAQAADTPSPQPVGPPLTSSERDGFRRAVSQCWNTGALSSAAQRVTVVVSAEMTEVGKPVSTSLRLLEASGGEGKAVTDAYDAARRAILRCGISGYDLPKEKYAQWREIEMTFNPEQMRTK